MVFNAEMTFGSTLNNPNDPRFVARANPLILPPWGREGLRAEIKQFMRVLLSARKKKVMLLNSSWGRLHPDLLVAATLGLWPRGYRPLIVLAGCMWQPTGGWPGIIERVVVKLADRAIYRYAVQSSEELSLFPETWGVSPLKMRLCPYFFRIGNQVDLTRPVQPGDHVFAGGNSHRDYEPL
ncbi:MAG TPA: hypothetical protein VEC93_21500, partial [Anaerolineae bacterium]|nr:hypothetical protein [Anaerolineae bacterium]